MSSSAPTIDIRIKAYLERLNSALSKLPDAEREDIVREIRTHILDSLENQVPQDRVGSVLQSLEAPERLAEHYRTEFLLARASRSFSPWLLLRTTWRWSKTGMKGFLVFMAGFVGYSMAGALLVSVLMKPFMPSRIGLWVAHGTFEFGTPSARPGLHEVLGHSYVPVTSALAFAAAVGTTQLLRWMIRKRVALPR